MDDRAWVATRKGLIELHRAPEDRWQIARTSFAITHAVARGALVSIDKHDREFPRGLLGAEAFRVGECRAGAGEAAAEDHEGGHAGAPSGSARSVARTRAKAWRR